MTGNWLLVEVAARLLERDEREAVLGDLEETGESLWRGLVDVLGLAFRRQAAFWKNWRPWFAAFGIALPGSLLLMGASVSVSSAYYRFTDPAMIDRVLPLARQLLLLIGSAWTSGFVAASVSRRTLWTSAVLCCLPCLFCLARFRVEFLSRSCLLLFLLPALLGVRQGIRIFRIRPSVAITMAVALTMLMIPSWSRQGPWSFDGMLIWPAWYLVAIARRPGSEAG